MCQSFTTFAFINLEMSKECIYDVCWSGQCKKPTADNSDFCEEHLNHGCGVSISTTKNEPRVITLSKEDLVEMLEKHHHGLKIEEVEYENENLVSIMEEDFVIHALGKKTTTSSTKCNKQAIGDCHSHAGPGVCGTPLCEEHKQTHKH
jgi:hypothetical protein